MAGDPGARLLKVAATPTALLSILGAKRPWLEPGFVSSLDCVPAMAPGAGDFHTRNLRSPELQNGQAPQREPDILSHPRQVVILCQEPPGMMIQQLLMRPGFLKSPLKSHLLQEAMLVTLSLIHI